MRRYDAIVIGGGPAGASTAAALAIAGWSIALVEKSEFPRRKVCGEFISATNARLLDRLGIGETWLNRAGPDVARVGLFADGTCVTAAMPGAQHRTFGRALGRDVLDDLLLQKARSAGTEVFQPWRAVTIQRHGDVSCVRIAARDDHAILAAPVIVAAHGSWEPGKLPSQLEKINQPSDLLGFKAHFRNAVLAPDLMPLIIFPGGYGGMVWSDSGRLSISCCIRRDTLAAIRAACGNVAAADALHRHLVLSCRGVREAIGNATLDGPWLAAGPIRPGIRARYADDIFRVGNIAGESHPIIAEGITMAIQSGWLLAAELTGIALRDSEARAAAGARYARAWRRQFALRVHAAATFATIALKPPGRATMRAMVNAFPWLLTVGAKLSGKTRPVPGVD